MSVASINFEALTGGVFSGLDSQQTALAVQALLESQSITDPSPDDEEDVFQCGKCKKQFNNFSAFVTHKQSPCGNHQHSLLQAAIKIEQGSSAANTGSKQSLPAYSASSISQSLPLAQNIVLADDLMTFTTPGEASMPTSTLQVGSNPFLSQISPPSSRTASLPTFIVSTSASAFSTSSSSAFSTALTSNQLQLQALPTVVTQHPGGLLGISGGEVGATQVILQQASGAQTILTPASSALGGATTQLGRAIQASGAKTLTLPTILRPGLIKPGDRKGLIPVPLTVIADGGEIPMAMSTQPAPHAAPQVPKLRRTKPLLEDPNNRKKLKCQYCDKTFAKNFDLLQHVRSHTGEKPFQCIVCGRAFAQKSNVKKHMQTHKVWPSGTGKTLPSQPAPQVISEQEEGTEKPLPTVPKPQVPPAKVIELSLDAHKAGSDGKDHKVKLNVVVDSSYICQYCPLKFKSYFQLKSHMMIHKEEQVYKCILKSCSQTFLDLDHFLEHTKAHEDNMSYRCHICNKLFPSLYELGVHQYSHSLYPNQGPKPGPRYFRCSKCNSKYSTPEALQHHLETVSHKHPCIHCGKMFTCERYLRRHLPLHGSIGDHKCDICGKRFKTDHYLRVHQLTHSDDKPFSCDLCPAAFNRKDKLKRHMLVHETNRKYRCPFRSHIGCTKEFNRPDKLKAHIICHSGIKPYKCKECDKTFTRRPNLRLHERGHRKDYSHTCDTCGKGFLREKLYRMHKCRTLGTAAITSITAETINPEGPQPESTETVPQTKAHATRRRMINITKGMTRFSRVAQTARRGRPRKGRGGGGRLLTKQDTIPTEPQPQTQENMYPRPAEHSEAREMIPVVFSQTSDVGTATISVVVGGDAGQYMTDDQQSSLVTNPDGSVVVIQPMDPYTHAQHHSLAADGTTLQVSGELTYSNNGTTVTEVVQVMEKPDILYDTSVVDDKQDILYNTSVAQDINLVASSSPSDVMTSYSLEYPSNGQQYTTYGTTSGFQQATLIATGPNMATLVMEGAPGEILTPEGIATIVAQAPDQFTDHTDAHSYSMLQYPISSHDGTTADHMETQDITIEHVMSDHDLTKATTIEYKITDQDITAATIEQTISDQDIAAATIQQTMSGNEINIEQTMSDSDMTGSTIEHTMPDQDMAGVTIESMSAGIVTTKME